MKDGEKHKDQTYRHLRERMPTVRFLYKTIALLEHKFRRSRLILRLSVIGIGNKIISLRKRYSHVPMKSKL